jgi:glutamine---fructose-6-phosphate transaminase (isomerizing)
MCGIVGYIGPRKASPILIEGLSSLEYRGYDSAGIAFLDGKGLEIFKDKGKVDNLRRIIGETPHAATMGIAHTRWATHGAPSHNNAHPHTDSARKIALVHNGIIENYASIKDKLISEGVAFNSETDTWENITRAI